MDAMETIERLRDVEMPQAITERDDLIRQREQSEIAARQAVVDKELALDDPTRYAACEEADRGHRLEVERLDKLIARANPELARLERELVDAEVELAAQESCTSSERRARTRFEFLREPNPENAASYREALALDDEKLHRWRVLASDPMGYPEGFVDDDADPDDLQGRLELLSSAPQQPAKGESESRARMHARRGETDKSQISWVASDSMGGLAKAEQLREPLRSNAIAEWHRRHDGPRAEMLERANAGSRRRYRTLET